MSTRDARKPAEVSADFHARLAKELAEDGFFAKRSGKLLVRAGALGEHRIDLTSSHRNAPGDVTCWVGLSFKDVKVAKLDAAWHAGGGLALEPFADEPPTNVADAAEASALIAHVRSRLSFFALLEDPDATLEAVCRRFVPGLLHPAQVAPYLRVHGGVTAVDRYARALLDGCPEIWPGFASTASGAPPRGSARPDSGSELATMLATHAPGAEIEAPGDVVRTEDRGAANLRCFYGLELRAWGEAPIATMLRSLDDERVLALSRAHGRLELPIDSPKHVQLTLAALGVERSPARDRPAPAHFQYRARHAPFAS